MAQWTAHKFIQAPESGGRIATAASQACLDRNVFLNVDLDGWNSYARSELSESFGDEIGGVAGDGWIATGEQVLVGKRKKKAIEQVDRLK